jgi:hypothetical protein
MSIRLFLARLTRKVAAVATVAAVWSAGPAAAADVTPSPAAAAAVGVYPGMPAAGCAPCEHGTIGNCAACGLARFGKGQLLHKNTLYPVNLCPGACFGYFQTQWRKWEDVCPYPYTGGFTPGTPVHAHGPYVPHTPVYTSPSHGPVLTPPRPVDQKMPEPKKPGNGSSQKPPGNGSDLPVIPVPNKFGP